MFRNLAYYLKFKLIFVLIFTLGCSNAQGPRFLDDLDGATAFEESKTTQRAVTIKAQGITEKAAKERARLLALDQVARELLPPEIYNEQVKKLRTNLNKGPQNYLIREDFPQIKKLESGLVGVSGSFLVDRLKIVQLFQKKMKILDQGHNAIVVLVDGLEDAKLENVDFKTQNFETSLVSAIETKLNQMGFKAINFQNILVSLQQNPQLQSKTNKLNPEELFTLASGKGERGEIYTKTMGHLKGMAKVIIRVQVLEVSFKNQTLAMSLNLSAVNISTPMGGTFANHREQVFWQGGKDAHPSAMMAAALGEMADKVEINFLPKVMGEMNIVDDTPGKFAPYSLSLVGFDQDEVEELIKVIKDSRSKKVKLGKLNLKQIEADPQIAILPLDYSGESDDLEGLLEDFAKEADLDVKDLELEDYDLTMVED